MKELPERWCIQATDVTREIINDFIISEGYFSRLTSNYMVHYPFIKGQGSAYFTPEKGYEEISYEQFKEYILGELPIINENLDYLVKFLNKLNIN